MSKLILAPCSNLTFLVIPSNCIKLYFGITLNPVSSLFWKLKSSCAFVFPFLVISQPLIVVSLPIGVVLSDTKCREAPEVFEVVADINELLLFEILANADRSFVKFCVVNALLEYKLEIKLICGLFDSPCNVCKIAELPSFAFPILNTFETVSVKFKNTLVLSLIVILDKATTLA